MLEIILANSLNPLFLHGSTMEIMKNYNKITPGKDEELNLTGRGMDNKEFQVKFNSKSCLAVILRDLDQMDVAGSEDDERHRLLAASKR